MFLKFLAKVFEMFFVESILEISSGIIPRRRMTLEVDHVGCFAIGTTAKEMIKADFVESCEGRERGNVTADIRCFICLGHHRHCVPSDMGADESFHFQIARIVGLVGHRYGIQVRRGSDIRNLVSFVAESLDEACHKATGFLG